jgi:hypothetical protein
MAEMKQELSVISAMQQSMQRLEQENVALRQQVQEQEIALEQTNFSFRELVGTIGEMQHRIEQLEQKQRQAPPASFAAVVSGGPSTSSSRAPSRDHPGCYSMPLGNLIKPDASYTQLVEQIDATLRERLKDEHGKPFELHRVENARVISPKPRSEGAAAPPPFVMFEVSRGDDPRLDKSRRTSGLKGTGFVIRDWLSKPEMQRRHALSQLFVKAKQDKNKKVSWRGADLVVDGVVVQLPAAAPAPVPGA